MEAAVNSKDFQLAAEIEKQLVPLKEALESKRPLTRSVLEARISEVQCMLDDAVSRKAYQECAPLQEKLDNLIKKRLDLPTIDELEEAVRKAENDVAEAAARRDFKGAASYQEALDNAIRRLEDAKHAEPNPTESAETNEEACPNTRFNSRADLELAIKEASEKVNDAISTKQFDKASIYQAELDELENLRPTLPSLEEMENKIRELKAEMDTAIEQKNFQKAESLHNEIDKLDTKCEEERSKFQPASVEAPQSETPQPEFVNEKGEKILFESRFKLEEEITRYRSLVHNAASSKKFKDAKEKQDLLDRLENLRTLLPTAQELTTRLSQAKADMEEAIHKKDFEEAERLHEIVEHIETQLKLEQSNIVQKPAITLNPPSVPAVAKAPTKLKSAVPPVATVASVAGSLRSKSSKKSDEI